MHNPPNSALTGLCLHYFLALRSIAIGVHLLTLVVAAVVFQAPLPWTWLFITLLTLGVYTLQSWWTLSHMASLSPTRFLRQLLVDILGLAVVTGLTGGTANPFVTLLMLPVIVAAATLPVQLTWLTAGAAALAYTVLMFVYLPFAPWGHHHGNDNLSTHIWGMWLGFLLAAGLIAAFVARIGLTLASHERELATARQRALETERTLALGTLAAGTAHELGSPLATIAVLARELELDTSDHPELNHQCQQLRSEVERCKGILARMAREAGSEPAQSGHAIQLDTYLSETLDEWQRLRPEASLTVVKTSQAPAPAIVVDRTLTQAVMNLLHNAADACPTGIEVEADWSESELHLCVRDHGPGLASEAAGRVGQDPFSTKRSEGGMGLGLYLTRMTLERIGGHLRIDNAPTAGVAAHLRLPLQGLKLPSPVGVSA